jgi:hypothetical protein
VQFDPDRGTPGHDSLRHRGTISADGAGLFANSWGQLAGFGGEITGFSDAYPSPASGLAYCTPAPDAIVPAPAGQTTTGEADFGGITPGFSETRPIAQERSDSSRSGLVIIADYDSTITDLPGTLYSEATGAITAAIDFYETAIATAMTITIDFGYGEVDGESLGSDDLGESLANYAPVTFGTLRGALLSHASSVGLESIVENLPTASADGNTWYVSDSELEALGLQRDIPRGTTVDGYVGLSSSLPFTYNPSFRAVSGDYDAIGVLEHEISEDMGRVANYGDDNFSPLDLFRYTSPGTIATSGTAAYFSIDGGQTNLAEFNNNDLPWGGDAGDWSSQPGDINPVSDDSYDAFSSPSVANTVSTTDLKVMEALGYTLAAACYAAGTRILTARGEVWVENLAVGDVVQARFAGLTPITWIGQRRIDCRRHPDPQQVWPVRIVAGAFGPNQPCRDLLLSPDHAVAVDGALITIRLLVNGASIRRETGVSHVHYFHIELRRHDLLLADGLAAESYLDTGDRGMFANAGVPIVLHPTLEEPAAQQRREAGSCLKLCGDPADVEPVWQALAARAKSLGLALPVIATTRDPGLCIVAGARRFTPALHDGGRYTFVLPALPGGARLRSRCAVPSVVRPWLEDRRRLGVMVRRIVLRRGTDVVIVAPDDPRLGDGWWAAERDEAAPWRWTDGDAALPPTDDFAIVEVLIGETPPYPLAEPACAEPMAGVHPAAQAADAANAASTRSAA